VSLGVGARIEHHAVTSLRELRRGRPAKLGEGGTGEVYWTGGAPPTFESQRPDTLKHPTHPATAFAGERDGDERRTRK
jgi:hypothetical protein